MATSWKEKSFDTWLEFREYLEDELNPAYTLFRGQADSIWSLQTSLDRLLRSLPVSFRNENLVQLHLERFMKATRGRRLGQQTLAAMSENEWWALGQHHGLATPLLDWSGSPYIASYFAFASLDRPDSEKRAIWALVPNALDSANRSILGPEEGRSGTSTQHKQWSEERDASKLTIKKFGELIETERPPIVEIVEPAGDDNLRLVNQAGAFTRSPILVDFENWVETLSDEFRVPVLLKLLVPNDDRFEALTALQKMNIHSQSMFPDLVGASVYCNEILSLQAETVRVNEEARQLLKFLKGEADQNDEAAP